jgi:hypothetical protein
MHAGRRVDAVDLDPLATALASRRAACRFGHNSLSPLFRGSPARSGCCHCPLPLGKPEQSRRRSASPRPRPVPCVTSRAVITRRIPGGPAAR